MTPFVIYNYKNYKNKRYMKTWKATIKEIMCEKPVVAYYVGDEDYDFVKKWFGCDEPDVEWYKIEEE